MRVKIINTSTKKKKLRVCACSVAASTGNWSAAIVKSKNSIAAAAGYESKAKGGLGCWLVLAERNDDYEILDVKTAKVDGEIIKADTYYKLANGEFVECEEKQNTGEANEKTE